MTKLVHAIETLRALGEHNETWGEFRGVLIMPRGQVHVMFNWRSWIHDGLLEFELWMEKINRGEVV